MASSTEKRGRSFLETRALDQQELLSAEMGCEMLKDELAQLRSRDEHARGLWLVGLYKLSKTVFFGAIGIGALRFLHHNFGEFVAQLIDAQRIIDPESHLASMLMDKADLVQSHQLRQFSMLTIGYAVLCAIEGTGLVMRRVWAEYFTVFVTLLGIPIEVYELIDRFTWIKVGVMLINVAVLAYLLWVLKLKRTHDAAKAH
jgi:uncharacterized membrane protein (DUF2068 family)